ncbi:MAG: hypothetical protein K2Y21_00320 [Phycisphaerales bacterium]|nr:hypothetical protein [Phycisphaerales bacterium]
MRTHLSWHTAVGTALMALASLTPFAKAQSFEVVPPTNASIAGDSNNSIPIGAGAGGTFQVLYPASQLVGLPIGGKITSIQLRLRNAESANWPPSASTIASYEIKMGGSTKTPATLSTTLADNIANPVVVRSGPLNLAAGAYPAGAATGSTPEGWGPVITLFTPYTYTGGPLVIELRNTGTSTVVYCDAVTSTDVGRALGNTTSNAETSGFLTSAMIIRLGITPPNTQAVTLPNANDTVAGSSENSIPLGAFSDGRHMSLYAADQFASVPPGSLITGMQLRLRNAETTGWPAADSTNADYEIWLSQSPLTPASMSNTYASNQLNAVRVRDGSYFLPAGVYPAGANTGTTPEGWGPVIDFQTPYLYQGGALAIDIQSAGGISPVKFADCVVGSAVANGKTASPRTATSSSGGSAFIVRLSFVPPVQSPFGDGVTKIYALKQFADTVPGDFYVGFARSIGFTSQYLYGPEQFQTVGPGTWLNEVSFRNNTPTAWPPALGNYPQFDVRLSRSPLTPATMSSTVASNSGSDAVTVRSGSLGVPAGAMAAKPATGTAAFTWTIPFAEPYAYRAGALDMLINNQGIAVGVSGQVDAVTGSNTTLQPFARGGLNPGTVNAATISVISNVPVARYSADAQVLVPNSLKDGVGFNGIYGSSAPTSSSEGTLQVLLAASELSYIPVGGLITSLSLVADSSQAAWPGATGVNADDLSIEISSAANQPQSMSTTFADNAGADATIVRSGPIAWEPGALPAGSTGRFGATITFDRGFVYKGGSLCITIRHAPVNNGGPNLRSAGPATATRAAFNLGNKAAANGSLFAVSGAAIQLGYIPAGTTPKSRIATPATFDRDLFGVSRTFQMLYNPEAVGVPVGATINGVTWRLEPGTIADFPSAGVSFTRFDLWMSTSPKTAATASLTVANNDGSDLVQVRSGPLTLKPGSWSARSTSDREDWGVFIQFTRPFVYRGGTLAFTIRSSVPTGPASGFFETTSDGAPVTDIQGVRDTSNPDAATGSFRKPPTTLFAFTDDAFCPWDLNNDGVVDDLDFQAFVLSYNILDCTDAGMALGCPGDFNFDRVVDDDDFQIFIVAYNAVLCP